MSQNRHGEIPVCVRIYTYLDFYLKLFAIELYSMSPKTTKMIGVIGNNNANASIHAATWVAFLIIMSPNVSLVL